jgi:hypothetical protein
VNTSEGSRYTYLGSKDTLKEKFGLFAFATGRREAEREIPWIETQAMLAGMPLFVQTEYTRGYRSVAEKREEVTG